MNINFKNDISSSYMTIEDVKEFSDRNFAVMMLTRNCIEGLLPFDYEILNGRTDMIYDISAREPFSKVYENKKMSFEDVKALLYSINSLFRNLNMYLLDPDNIILKKECIFINEKTGKYEYCYYPFYSGDITLEMRELFAQLLSLIDYKDRRAVRLAYNIQKCSQSDNFTIEDIIRITSGISMDMNPDEMDLEDYGTAYWGINSASEIYENALPKGDMPVEHSGLFNGLESTWQAGRAEASREADEYSDSAAKNTFRAAGENKRKETSGRKKALDRNKKYDRVSKVSDRGFFEKAGDYFRDSGPSEIFDDINELKIFRKISGYDDQQKKDTNVKTEIRNAPDGRKARNKKMKRQNTHNRSDSRSDRETYGIPDGIIAFQNSFMEEDLNKKFTENSI